MVCGYEEMNSAEGFILCSGTEVRVRRSVYFCKVRIDKSGAS
jgi:hypothetical protein